MSLHFLDIRNGKEPPLLERYFRLSENHTTIRAEFLGGLTTFLTMAYIVAVNPKMLSETGMPIELGDVVLGCETCIAEAAAQRHRLCQHRTGVLPALLDREGLAHQVTGRSRTPLKTTLRRRRQPQGIAGGPLGQVRFALGQQDLCLLAKQFNAVQPQTTLTGGVQPLVHGAVRGRQVVVRSCCSGLH